MLFKSYIFDNMDENDVQASLSSVTLGMFWTFATEESMNVTAVTFQYGIDYINKNQHMYFGANSH